MTRISFVDNLNNLKGTEFSNISVAHDLTPSQHQQLKKLWAEAKHKQESESGDWVYQVVGHPSRWTVLHNVNNVNISTSQNKTLICWYTNADSLWNKLAELKDRIKSASPRPDIIAITEVKAKDTRFQQTRAEFSIDGYDIFMCNVENTTGRGIIIYTDTRIEAYEVKLHCTFQEHRLVCTKLENGEQLILTCLYHSPSSSDENNQDLNKLIKEIDNTSMAFKLTSDAPCWNTGGTCDKKTTIETTRAIWSNPLFMPCVALDQFNHAVYIFMAPRCYNLIKTIISCRAYCPLPVNYDATFQTFHGFTDFFFHNAEKLGTDVSFTNSLNHWPQHHCAKKASIATTREQSVIVTSQLLATGFCIDDVTIGQHFEPSGAVMGWNVDLRQLSHRNHINDWCTEYTGSEILGRYCSMSARDLGFRGDSGYFY